MGARLSISSQPQHLLLTLLGDYWCGRQPALPLRALIDVLAEFGITETGARAAVNRLARRQLLRVEKVGRNSHYRLTDRAHEVLTDGQRRILSFGADGPRWEGQWAVVAFSVAEDQRGIRHTLRTRLRWLGFAPLYDGLWISPRPALAPVLAVLAELSVTTATVFQARVCPASGYPPLAAWDLDALRSDYAEFLDTFNPLLLRVRGGEIGSAEALVERTSLMDAWRRFPARDPDLPPELLPPDWPRMRARGLFVTLYDGLGPLAAARIRQLLARTDPELAGDVQHLCAALVEGNHERASITFM